MSAHKFWDSDIRRDPSLLVVAIEYARDYCGDFEFMVGAKSVVQETGSLPLPMARAVLNCMRTDPRANVPPKPSQSAPTRHEIDNVIPIHRDDHRYEVADRYANVRLGARRPKPEPVKVIARYHVKIKAPFGITRVNAGVIHRTTPDAEARWHRRRLADNKYSDALEFEYLRVTWACGRDTKDPRLFGLEAFTMRPTQPHEEALELPYCKGGCFSRQCPKCGSKNQLSNDAPPDTPIEVCCNCGEAIK